MPRLLARSLRMSLTLSHMAVVLLVLATYALAVYGFVGRNLSQTLDEQLRGDLQWAASMADLQPDGTLKWFDEDVDGGAEAPWLRVSSDGRVIFRTAVAERNYLPMADPLIDRPDGRIVAVSGSGSRARILTARTRIHDQSVVLQVARSERQMRTQLNELALLLGCALPLGVFMAAGGGYLLADKALAPVEHMASRAAAITAERLNDRLPVVSPDDELGRLATAFNQTLGRLESSFNQMRHFTADVSHQLRTPLTAVRLAGEVGLRDAEDLDAARAVIGRMLGQIDRLCTLVDRLLSLSRAQAEVLSRDVIELSDLAGEVVNELGILAEEKGQALTFEVPAGVPTTVFSDKSLLRQAVTNIVHNAIKYSPSGGAIRVAVSRIGGHAVLEVQDTGPGIPPSLRDRLFDRFCRADQRRQGDQGHGLGLGLAIARWAVEANDGTIRATSSHDGSTFRIALPLSVRSPHSADSQPAPIEPRTVMTSPRLQLS
jgi:signal transduction histidine kinase